MTWLVDPVTREPLPALSANPRPIDHAGTWVTERDPATNVPLRIGWSPCHCDECEATWEALKGDPDRLRELLKSRRP